MAKAIAASTSIIFPTLSVSRKLSEKLPHPFFHVVNSLSEFLDFGLFTLNIKLHPPVTMHDKNMYIMLYKTYPTHREKIKKTWKNSNFIEEKIVGLRRIIYI